MFFRKWLSLLLLTAMIAVLCGPAVGAAEALDITAESVILVDADSGKVLYQKNPDKRLPPASMTKLMTLVLGVEALRADRVEYDETVVASENAWRLGGSQIYLEPGEKMSYRDMMVAIAVGSANDACVAVAEHLEGSHEAFVEKMNKKAAELGMKNTHYVNSYGLHDPNHYSTARDMAILGRYALNFPELLELTSIKEYDLRGGEFKLYNTNKLLWWYEGADGFKTGWHNEAKYCLVSTVKRNNLRLVAVVMGCPEPRGNFSDSMAIYNYGFARYAYKGFVDPGAVCGLTRVGKGTSEAVEVVTQGSIGAICEKGQEKQVTWKPNIKSYVNAPVKKGDRLGEAQVFIDGKLVKRVPLVAAKDVPLASPLNTVKKAWMKIFLL
ncbi:MAG: D-alanyl-D-alanine carboxypeptidase [Syntrophomonadaceae bacterium]|nr:D-alanyl-D-alanine carboxypeptidase [Syntrophomonadaceae bacterium]